LSEDHEYALLTKTAKGHDIEILVELATSNAIIQCLTCKGHVPGREVDFDDDESMTFVEAEIQMHAAGNSSGWHLGLGFSYDE